MPSTLIFHNGHSSIVNDSDALKFEFDILNDGIPLLRKSGIRLKQVHALALCTVITAHLQHGLNVEGMLLMAT